MIVMALSIIMALCGMMLGISAEIFDSSNFVEAFKPLRAKRDLATSALIIMAALAFVTGLWGIGTYRIRNRIFVAIFGGAAIAIAVVAGGLAAILNSLTNLDSETMNSICPGQTAKNGSFEPIEDVKASITEIDRLNAIATFYMCSPVCPCLASQVDSSWTDIQDSELEAKYERTPKEVSAFNQMIFYSEEQVTAGNLQTFSTFSDCVDAIAA